MNPSPPTCDSTQDPLTKTRQVRFRLRSDLLVSRQLDRGSPVYVVHDPVTFRSHRLSVLQYRTLAALNPDESLGDNFGTLVRKHEFSTDQEESFYQLVSSFTRLGLVVTNTSGDRLYQQHQHQRSLQRRHRLLGFLFLQVPLVNPDRFLSRTVHRVSWLFSRTFAAIWLLGMTAAAWVIISRLAQLTQPLNSVLALSNLPFLWGSFVVLKVWHELGHGYACKKFGGAVPEMGTILIAGTPAAYVDATSAWSFPERSQRLIVMCGGMFFESLVFIPSVFVWAFSTSPMLQSCAYQLMVMTSLVTVLFNANPLMKFDGYFIFSELIGIQNLRPRADAYVKSLLAGILLGLRPGQNSEADSSITRRITLVAYGISATLYRFFLIISIAMVVAMKFPLVGLLLAAFHIGSSVLLGSIKLARYLLASPQTASVRGRARLVAAGVLLGLPLATLVVPVPFGVIVQGVVAAESETYVNVTTPGELQATHVVSGEQISADVALLQLSNDRTVEQLHVAEASLREAETQLAVARENNPVLAAEVRGSVRELQQQVSEYSRQVRELTVTTSGSGQVVRLIADTDRGRYLPAGHPLAVVVDGRPVLRTWVNQDQLGAVRTDAGTPITFRIPGRSTSTFSGQVISVQPAAEQTFDTMALTHVAGGELLVNPSTGQPLEPVFQIDIEPEPGAFQLTEHGARVSLNLTRRSESIAAWAARRCLRFVHKLLVA